MDDPEFIQVSLEPERLRARLIDLGVGAALIDDPRHGPCVLVPRAAEKMLRDHRDDLPPFQVLETRKTGVLVTNA